MMKTMKSRTCGIAIKILNEVYSFEMFTRLVHENSYKRGKIHFQVKLNSFPKSFFFRLIITGQFLFQVL